MDLALISSQPTLALCCCVWRFAYVNSLLINNSHCQWLVSGILLLSDVMDVEPIWKCLRMSQNVALLLLVLLFFYLDIPPLSAVNKTETRIV